MEISRQSVNSHSHVQDQLRKDLGVPTDFDKGITRHYLNKSQNSLPLCCESKKETDIGGYSSYLLANLDESYQPFVKRVLRYRLVRINMEKLKKKHRERVGACRLV